MHKPSGRVIGTGSTNMPLPNFLPLMCSSLWQGTRWLIQIALESWRAKWDVRLEKTWVSLGMRSAGEGPWFSPLDDFARIGFQEKRLYGFEGSLAPSWASVSSAVNLNCWEKWSLGLLSALITYSYRETKQGTITCTPRSNETGIKTGLKLHWDPEWGQTNWATIKCIHFWTSEGLGSKQH